MLSQNVATDQMRRIDGKSNNDTGSSVCIMRPNPTGVWGKDNVLGQRYADNFVIAMGQVQDPSVLLREVDRFHADGEEYRGIAVGFFHRIAELAIRP